MSRNKQKGTTFESLIVGYLRDRLGDDRIERRTQTGANDRGDITGIRTTLGERLVIECKNHATLNLSGWLTEAHTEAGNDDAAAGIVTFKRRGKGQARDQYVLMDLETLAVLLGADKEWETE